MDSFRVVCVNDRAKPDGFVGQWVQKDEIYTVIDAKHLTRQRMTLGYKLAELEIASDSVYQYFLANRFRPLSEEDEMMERALEELMEEVDEVWI